MSEVSGARQKANIAVVDVDFDSGVDGAKEAAERRSDVQQRATAQQPHAGAPRVGDEPRTAAAPERHERRQRQDARRLRRRQAVRDQPQREVRQEDPERAEKGEVVRAKQCGQEGPQWRSSPGSRRLPLRLRPALTAIATADSLSPRPLAKTHSMTLARGAGARATRAQGGRHPERARRRSKLVPTLPVQELYYAIKEVGLADAAELVALATPAADAGLRRSRRLGPRSPRRDASSTAGSRRSPTPATRSSAASIEALDPETIALWLQRQASVYDLTIEEPPDEPQGHYYPTPDRFYLLDILPGGEEGKALERILDWIYRTRPRARRAA